MNFLYFWAEDLFYRSDVLYILHCLVHVSKVGFVHPILSLRDILYLLCPPGDT